MDRCVLLEILNHNNFALEFRKVNKWFLGIFDSNCYQNHRCCSSCESVEQVEEVLYNMPAFMNGYGIVVDIEMCEITDYVNNIYKLWICGSDIPSIGSVGNIKNLF